MTHRNGESWKISKYNDHKPERVKCISDLKRNFVAKSHIGVLIEVIQSVEWENERGRDLRIYLIVTPNVFSGYPNNNTYYRGC